MMLLRGGTFGRSLGHSDRPNSDDPLGHWGVIGSTPHGIGALIRRDQTVLSVPCEDTTRSPRSAALTRALIRTQPCWRPELRNKFLLFISHPVGAILL